MTKAERHALLQIASALTAYSAEYQRSPAFRATLDNVPVPGGENLNFWAREARKLSLRYPVETERAAS